jgi:hypothetical protein
VTAEKGNQLARAAQRLLQADIGEACRLRPRIHQARPAIMIEL